MRTIKFRAQRVDNNEWIDGDLMRNYIHHQGFLTIVQNGCVYYKVKPETVSQFTGLFDKNEVEIYEGNIVKYDGKNHKIKYFDSYGMFGLVGKSSYRKFDENIPMGSGGSSTPYRPYILSLYYQKRLEVIGNIFENKNLIM